MLKMRLATLGMIMSVVLVVAAVLVVGGAVIIVKDVEKVSDAWNAYAKGPVAKGIHLADMKTALGYGGMIHQFKNYVLRRTPDRAQKARTAMAQFKETVSSYRRLGVNIREDVALAAVSKVAEEYETNLRMIEKLVAAGKSTNEIDAVVKVDDDPALEGLAALEAEFVKARDDKTLEFEAAREKIISLATTNTVATGLILLSVVIALFWFTHWRMLRPLNDMVDCMKDLAAGDNHVEIAALGRTDEIGDMAAAVEIFRANAQNLADIIETITLATQEVTNAAKEISAGSMDLSQRTEHQAASIQETSASMAQVAAMVAQNARNAAEASQLSTAAQQVAEKGRGVVDGAVTAMGEIASSSNRISDIIGVIDEIAFQTNLLALNAAVEAARAGDAGRGFAVVATEVGKLARRSSDAAKDIKDLIDTSEKHVHQGVELVDGTGTALLEIVSSVREVADLIADIAVANKEQTGSIQEVKTAVAQMDEMTQQNSALVEESAAATRALEDQALFLDQSVAFLKKGDAAKNIAQPKRPPKPKEFKVPASYASSINRPTKGAETKATKKGTTKENSFDDDDWLEF